MILEKGAGVNPRSVPKEYRQRKQNEIQHYDWTNDPQQFKIDGHIAPNRCFKCGYKFVGSQYAAFCNICDLRMTPDPDIAMYIVTERPPKGSKDAEADGGKGYWTTRIKYIASRIRIPEDVENEAEYKKKLEGLNKESDPLYKPHFQKADELV